MKRRRILGFFLLVLSIFISLNIAYLYNIYYDEVDLLARKHISDADEENFLTFIKDNPRVFDSPGLSVQHHIILSSGEVFFFHPYSFHPQDSKAPVLRC
jgi:hypothetical protein